MNKPTVVDLFCGAGGASKGFMQAGFEAILGVDKNKDALKTFALNHSKANVLLGDVLTVNHQAFLIADGWIACPPCQDFSSLRDYSARLEPNSRRDLVVATVERFLSFKPKFLFMENVKDAWNSEEWREAVSLLESGGYQVTTWVVRCEEFGIPQTRHRSVLVATDAPDFCWPSPEIGLFGGPVSVEEAWKDMPLDDHLDLHSRIGVEVRRRLQELRPERNHKDRYGRMNREKPSPTLTTKFLNISCGRFVHFKKDRGITLREGARIQTFPDSFKWHGSMTSIARQIGNAVPPLLAKKFAINLKEWLCNRP